MRRPESRKPEPSGRRFDASLRSARGASALIGVDEAGRGPWAGPVVAAAVLLPEEPSAALDGVRDSKLLSAARRESLYEAIRREAVAVAVSWAHAPAVDRENILRATLSAMGRAVKRLGRRGLVVVDGNRAIPGLALPQLPVVDGDRLSLSVSCASIVAKVLRDRWMQGYERRYPGYGLGRHKGYGTAEHREALERLGPCPAHRRSFSPVRALLDGVR